MAKDGYRGQEAINALAGEEIFNDGGGSAVTAKYDPEQYQWGKVIGKRLPTGQQKLRKLTARHKNVIALHLRSLSNRDIAFITGLAEGVVGNILRDPLSQEVISNYLEGIEQELLSLTPMAIDALRSGLGDGSVKTRLNAADKFFRATGRYAQSEKAGDTAEDVLARALARVAEDNSATLRQLTRTPPPMTLEQRPDVSDADVSDEGASDD